jgi:hypothetical protein
MFSFVHKHCFFPFWPNKGQTFLWVVTYHQIHSNTRVYYTRLITIYVLADCVFLIKMQARYQCLSYLLMIHKLKCDFLCHIFTILCEFEVLFTPRGPYNIITSMTPLFFFSVSKEKKINT